MQGKGAEYLAKVRALVEREAEEAGFKWEPTLVLACATFGLMLPRYHADNNLFSNVLKALGGPDLVHHLSRAGIDYTFLLQFGLPLLLIFCMRHSLQEYGLGLGDKKLGSIICIVFYVLYIPCFAVLFTNSGFQEYYGGVAQRYTSWGAFLAREVPLVAMLSLRTEFFFRGFLLQAFKKHYGAYVGILVQLIPYVLVHSGKAEMEALGSLPVGLALGYLAARTGSIWYGALLHGSIALLFNALILLIHFMGQ